MSILFVTSTRVGDAVLSTGVLRRLLDQHPDHGVTIACGPAPASLFGAVPRLERVIAMAKQPRGGHWIDLWRAVAGRRWDLAVDLRGSLITRLVWARRRVRAAPDDKSLHRVRWLSQAFGWADDPPAPHIWTSPTQQAEAQAALPPGGPILALGPTANWGGKQWPADRFAALVQQMTGPGGALAGARVAVFGAANERAMAEPLLAAIPADRRVDLIGRFDLAGVAACLARAALYVGNDSGLMHMAAAMGTPTLGLFGPSHATLYGPWGPLTAFVRTDLSYDEIMYSPGYNYRTQVSHMDTLPVARVTAAAEALLARAAAHRAA